MESSSNSPARLKLRVTKCNRASYTCRQREAYAGAEQGLLGLIALW